VSQFGERPGHRAPFHYGIDISASRDTPLLAIENGTIVTNAFEESRGNYVELRGDSGFLYRYLHMPAGSAPFDEGQRVGAGVQIGAVDSTGNSSGDHLHLTILNTTGTAVDPFPILNEAGCELVKV
jgi:murein DD-endopeptidase MepM/ murein hydrolase activator NlpD